VETDAVLFFQRHEAVLGSGRGFAQAPDAWIIEALELSVDDVWWVLSAKGGDSFTTNTVLSVERDDESFCGRASCRFVDRFGVELIAHCESFIDVAVGRSDR